MLKYLLLFIIMVLLIIGLIITAHFLFKNADKIREKMALMMPRPRPLEQEEQQMVGEPDVDDISGRGFGKIESNYG